MAVMALLALAVLPLAAATNCSAAPADASMFPPDLFTLEQMRAGLVALPVLGILYMFLGLALVCDNYFVPSLDVLTEQLGLAPDVAGATFMAAGGSAPELFTSIIGVFLTKSDVGIGTITGSAVFNVLFVIAACAFASSQALSLTAWPLVRDTFFYSVALALLVAFFSDNKVMWWEALILFLWYILYVSFMKFNPAAESKFESVFNLKRSGEDVKAAMPGGIRGLRGKTGLVTQMQRKVESPAGGLELGAGGMRGLQQILGTSNQVEQVTAAPAEVEEKEEKEEEEEEEWVSPVWSGMRGRPASKVLCALSLPLTLAMAASVPDPRRPGWRAAYPLTFLMSLVWITVFSYCMVWWATMVCTVTGLSEATMAITFLAAGTSVPDLISSVLVARAGHGDMAVSSSIGSNLFDVTVGLPLPWLAYSLIHMEESVAVVSKGIACQIGPPLLLLQLLPLLVRNLHLFLLLPLLIITLCPGMLFLMLMAVIASIVAFRWRMTKPMGALMMALYAAFLAVALAMAECWIQCFI